jgi:hypothetical protein
MRVFADLQMCEQMNFRTHLRQAIVAGERDQSVVANAIHVYHHVRGVCFCKNAFQKSDHAPKIRGMSPLAQVCGSLLVFMTLGVAQLAAQSTPAAESEWRITLEASFLRPGVQVPVKDAKKTVLTAGVYREGEFTAFNKKEWEGFAIGWDAFEKVARANAAKDWQSQEIRLKRDRRDVVLYAEILSKNGSAGCCVFSDAFGPGFFETMGEVFLFALPSRYQCFVFPKFGGNVSAYSEMVHSAYRASAQPISVELFEWEKGQIRAVGVFERP